MSSSLRRRVPLRAKAPPPRPAKVTDYTPRPRPVVRADHSPDAGKMVRQHPKDAPVRDEAYRRLVAALPCIACGKRGRSQAAHGPALGKGIKASDDDLFPLCADELGAPGCHTLFDQYVLFDATQRRDMAALWAAQTRARLGRPNPARRAPDLARHSESTFMDMEQEIAEKANKAPRVTPADIEAEIASEHYFTAGDGVVGVRAIKAAEGLQVGEACTARVCEVPGELDLLTFCVLVLRNGFTVTGESACASPENFDAEIGRKVARANAVGKVWPLLGFRLRDKLAAA